MADPLPPTEAPAAFDWSTWIDAERQAAEERTADPLNDDRYDQAMDLYARQQHLRQALTEVEQQARAMEADRG